MPEVWGRRVPLMERQVLTEPFEVMAFDLFQRVRVVVSMY